MTDSPDGGPHSSGTMMPRQMPDDAPRTLAAYREGHPLPPMETEEDRDAFEAEQRRGWQDRS